MLLLGVLVLILRWLCPWEAAMPKAEPFDCDDPLHELDRSIAAAMASLHGARAAADRSPNADTIRQLDILEERVDYLLDKRLRCMGHAQTADELVTQ